jgi:hypothetical protein
MDGLFSYFMENPIKIDDLGVAPLQETSFFLAFKHDSNSVNHQNITHPVNNDGNSVKHSFLLQ